MSSSIHFPDQLNISLGELDELEIAKLLNESIWVFQIFTIFENNMKGHYKLRIGKP